MAAPIEQLARCAPSQTTPHAVLTTVARRAQAAEKKLVLLADGDASSPELAALLAE